MLELPVAQLLLPRGLGAEPRLSAEDRQLTLTEHLLERLPRVAAVPVGDEEVEVRARDLGAAADHEVGLDRLAPGDEGEVAGVPVTAVGALDPQRADRGEPRAHDDERGQEGARGRTLDEPHRVVQLRSLRRCV